MSRLKILIVEDNLEEAINLQTTLTEFNYTVVGVADDFDKACTLYTEKQPNLFVIDIYLNGKPDGVEFVRKIGESNKEIPVVFLTGNYDAVTFYLAKTVNPHNYLLKPYNPLDLQYAIELVLNKVKNISINESDTLFIKKGSSIVKVNMNDIKYIEVEGKYSKIVCTHEKFLIQQPLKELQSQLPTTLFLRIHRNYIINISEVIKVNTISNEVFLKSGESLFFSRRFLDNLFTYFKILK